MNPFQKVTSLIERNKQTKDYNKNLRITIVRVMQTVGGYDQFMSLPLSAYQEITKGLIELDKLEMEKHKALMGGSAKGKRSKP